MTTFTGTGNMPSILILEVLVLFAFIECCHDLEWKKHLLNEINALESDSTLIQKIEINIKLVHCT